MLAPLYLRSAATALERARRIDDLPGIGLARRLATWRNGWRDRGVTTRRIVAATLAVICAALLLIPTQLEITARGRLWPSAQRDSSRRKTRSSRGCWSDTARPSPPTSPCSN
ncbi:MAG: hypothetical protein QM811_08205 [Pirellulales bacterium]